MPLSLTTKISHWRLSAASNGKLHFWKLSLAAVCQSWLLMFGSCLRILRKWWVLCIIGSAPRYCVVSSWGHASGFSVFSSDIGASSRCEYILFLRRKCFPLCSHCLRSFGRETVFIWVDLFTWINEIFHNTKIPDFSQKIFEGTSSVRSACVKLRSVMIFPSNDTTSSRSRVESSCKRWVQIVSLETFRGYPDDF